MAAKAYAIQYAHEAVRDIKLLRAYDQRKIVDAIEDHLRHSPTQVSRARIKLMIQPFWSGFRLREEDFRIYYDVDEQDRTVNILRVLKKERGTTPGDSS